MSGPEYEVTQVTDDVVIDTVIKGEYDEASLSFNDPPRFKLLVSNPSGIMGHILDNGKEVEIRRNGDLVFTGIVETVKPEDGSNGSRLEVRGVHKAYKLIQQHLCDAYDFDEDDNPRTTRDAITINPWRYFILRKPGGALDEAGDELPIDGVTFDEVYECLLGTRFVHQIDFRDLQYLLPSQTGRDAPAPSIDKLINAQVFFPVAEATAAATPDVTSAVVTFPTATGAASTDTQTASQSVTFPTATGAATTDGQSVSEAVTFPTATPTVDVTPP